MTKTPRCFMFDLLDTIDKANKYGRGYGADAPVSLYVSGGTIFMRVSLVEYGGRESINVGRTLNIRIAKAIRTIKEYMYGALSAEEYVKFCNELTEPARLV